MPELPEVETIRRALNNRIAGRRITEYVLLRKDYLRRGGELIHLTPGETILRAERRGKFILLYLTGPYVLLHHLGMSGRLLLTKSTDALEPHTHIRILLDKGSQELRQRDPRRFGFAALFRPHELSHFPPWANLGQDPFEIDPPQFFDKIHKRKRPIKSLLLDQNVIAGLGNIYADESLFRAGLSPLRPACGLEEKEAAQLLDRIREVLNEAIDAGGSSTNDYRHLDGTLGEFQQRLRVYRRTGLVCYRCGSAIERRLIAGRKTHFCPLCQR
ncbi:MAG: bifunctional DNA-formamidopyrimidine glycosylase/DNA-(apurinic or apyrimidinic site) lyase [Candidatus Omnitrophota bacterium]